jgi:hypothetical protein
LQAESKTFSVASASIACKPACKQKAACKRRASGKQVRKKWESNLQAESKTFSLNGLQASLQAASSLKSGLQVEKQVRKK